MLFLPYNESGIDGFVGTAGDQPGIICDFNPFTVRNDDPVVSEFGQIVGDIHKADSQNISDLLLRKFNPVGRSGRRMKRKQVQKITYFNECIIVILVGGFINK